MAKRRKKFVPRAPRVFFRTNEKIRVPEIRLVGDNMEEISKVAGRKIEAGIQQTYQVQKWADELGLDLVEISPKAIPPVCKIIDFKKFLYERKKKDKEMKSKSSKTVVKELRFTPNTDDHDFEFKMRHAYKFLEEGAKVKAFVHFRGRTIIFKDKGEILLLKLLKELEAVGAAEALPKMEGRRMIVMISPKKKGKKNSINWLRALCFSLFTRLVICPPTYGDF